MGLASSGEHMHITCTYIYTHMMLLVFSLWMVSTSTRLFLNTLPLHFMYRLWYRCLSIFLASRYFLRRRRSTRSRRIQITADGIRASLRPMRLPVPVWRPLALAARCLRWLYRECTLVGFLMTRPSFASLRIFRREFAMEISLTSLGSSQILRIPHFNTEAARRFCSLRETILHCGQWEPH